jgi:glycosyltransferase involved in cell wall biosynthesis
MKLSILIPAISGRPRHEAIGAYSGHPDVEVVCLLDNKRRSVGAKRQALLELSQGEYVTFLDDDDRHRANYLEEVLPALEKSPDLVVYHVDCIHFGMESLVKSSVRYENEEYNPDGVTYRKPIQNQVWRREIATQSRFPDTSFGEDFSWAEQLWDLVRYEVSIPKALYHYRCGEWSATQ